MSLDPAQVERLADLAGIGLEPGEAGALAEELSAVLEEIALLREVDLPDRDAGDRGARTPTLHEGGSVPRSRHGPDAPDPLTRPPSELAPDWRQGFFVVPRPSAFDGEDR